MELYCDKCKKLIITDADNCIVCINNQLDKAERKLQNIKECIKTQKDSFGNYVYSIDKVLANKILQIIESEK